MIPGRFFNILAKFAEKPYSQISQEYGISHSALANWIKKYSEVKMDDNTILTSKQIKELQRHPYDNAVMICFFKYLKKEEVNRETYSSLEDLNLAVFQYINGFYNSIRPHSHNNGLTPIQAESDFF